jgi:hypothetical protein
MGLTCDYFVAASDDEAARTATWTGGPGAPSAGKAGWFRKKASAPVAQPMPTVELPGMDPVVTMATLEELLAAGVVDELLAANADAQVSDPRQDVMVFRVSGALTDGLARASASRLREVAVPWSQTDELSGADPRDVADGLLRLSALAQEARNTGRSLYCWTAP